MLTMLHMFRLALPGSAMWYLVFDLISSPSILIRIRGLRLLCFSFYTLDGYQQLDLKQLTAFEKLQGFSMMSEFLGRYETDDRTMGLLLTLLFWRTRVVSSLLSAPGGQYMPHGAQNFRTDMHLNEQIGVSITDNSSEMETLLANDDALLIDRDDEEDDEESEDDEDEMADIHECEGGNLSLNLSFQEEIDLVYASQEGRAPGEAVSSKGSGIGTAHSVETVELEPTGQKMEKPPLPTKLNNSSNKHNVELIKIPQMLQVLFRSLYNAKTVSVVEMAMRALCDCICMCNYVNMDGTYYSMFNHFLCSSQLSFVLNTAGVIDRGFSLHRMSLEEFVKLQITASRRNFETLCLQKDWLLWACECLVALQIRFLPKNSTTIDSKGTRGADVANNTAETLNIYNDSVYQFIQMVFMIDMMEKPNTYRTVLQLVRLPPMYANEAVQGVESQFHSGVVDPNSWSCVASSSEATNMTTSLQIMVLYDIFDSFESCNLFNDALSSIVTAASASVNTSIISVVGGGSSTGSKVAELSMNLLKNFGLLLEQLHERVLDFYTFCMPVSANANVVTNSITNAELNPNALLNLALYERILEVIDTLSVNTLPSIRNRLKETLLYEMRSVFVAKILMENLKNFDEYLVRATSLLKVRASLQNSITSTENKLLIDTQVLHLLLNWFTGVTEEIAVVQEELYEMRKSATMEPGRYDHCKHRLDNSLFPAQFMYLELIQMCIGVSSSECRKYIQRLGVELGTSIAKYNAYVTNTQAQGRDNHQSGDQNQNRDSDIDTEMQEDILVEVDGNAATILLDGLRNTLELPAVPITASNSSDVVSKHTGDGTATTVVGYEKPNESIGTVTSSQGSSWWSSWATSNSGVANSTSESGSGSPAVTYYTASKRSNSLYGTRPALGDVESGISSSDRVEFERVGSNHSDVSYITENTEFPFYPLDSSEFLHWYNALEQRYNDIVCIMDSVLDAIIHIFCYISML